jgi:hypothetical protein
MCDNVRYRAETGTLKYFGGSALAKVVRMSKSAIQDLYEARGH